MSEKKILIIGLDSATFDLIHPLVEEGRLPNIAKLMNEGSWGELKSTIPPVTYPAWQSFMTGKNPGKHGVFSFSEPDSKTYEFRLPSAVKGFTPFWEILSEHDRTMVIFELPYTYPPKKIKGAVVSGFDKPLLCNDYTHPKDLKLELDTLFGKVSYKKKTFELYDGLEGTDLEDFTNILDKKADQALYLMEKYDWRLFIAVFMQIDTVQHHFWRFIDENHPKYDKKLKKYNDSINKVYIKCDEIIGSIIQKTDKDTSIFIVSDHGAGPLYKEVNLNVFLKDIGLLNLNKRVINPSTTFSHSTRKLIFRKIFEISDRIGTLRLIEKHPWIVPQKVKQIFDPRDIEKGLHHYIDWSKTKAFSKAGSIRINLKGKYSKGIVESGEEYEKLREYIIHELYKLKDPETGEKLVKKVYKREELYFGPYVDRAADLFVRLKSTYKGHDLTDELISINHTISGNHREEGILILYGNEIKRKNELFNSEIIDIAPTVLYLMGFPIPKDMDGKVLIDAFNKDFLDENKIQFADYSFDSVSNEDEKVLRDDEEREIRNRLKLLGYDI